MKFQKSSDDKWEPETNVPSENELRFSDPRVDPIKIFVLFLRKDLPRAVKICQGLCGKSITPDEKCMLVKSCGTSHWSDKNTGQEMSKFGPMYIHFNEKCLINFDCDRYYGPGSRFDYERIEVGLITQALLNKVEKEFLTQLGVAFLQQ